MINKILRILLIIFSIVIGLYPALYFLIDRKFGLLALKSASLLASTFWNIGFYTHIILGGLALFIGWTQFSSKFRNKNLVLHRWIGKIYVTAVLLSSVAGIGIGFFATGGFLSSLGFICLGVIWFYTTLMAYVHIRNKEIIQHQKMMIYSYSASFAAVTLRLWLPLLVISIGEFKIAYTIVAWLCWIPNLFIAYLLSKQVATRANSYKEY